MVDFRIRGKAGVMGEIRTVVHKKTEVEVIPGVNFGIDSAKKKNVGSATPVFVLRIRWSQDLVVNEHSLGTITTPLRLKPYKPRDVT